MTETRRYRTKTAVATAEPTQNFMLKSNFFVFWGYFKTKENKRIAQAFILNRCAQTF